MNIEWIKNKSGEKFYPVTHSTAVLYDDTGKTVKEAIDEKGGSGGSSGVNAVKMNGSTKSPVDGVVDLGTVITSHQDISGKQDKSTAVTHTTSTAAGSATQPVYVNSSGVATACTYTLGKSVPSNAVFTDTNTWRGIQNNLTSDSTTDSLSAAQGKALKALVDGKTSLTIGTTSTTAAAGNHTHSSYVNQNAFSNVVVGSTTVAADSATDTLTLVAGSNVTITPDATNDKITIAATDTTYSAATQSAQGLMSAADKKKLDGIAAGATAVTSSTVSGWGFKTTDNNTTYTLTQDATDGHKITLTPSSGSATTITIPDNNTTYSAATTSAAGLMSAADKTKLNGIASGANAYSLPTASASTLGGVKVGTNLSISNGVLSATNTTYSSKAAASGGTDVSLVTTGEKYTWNNKTSNTGTVTSVSVKMNGASKGTVTTSGTIDLGTVITSNDIPFKFGKDSNGNYGYYKDGADTVTPFKKDSIIAAAMFRANVANSKDTDGTWRKYPLRNDLSAITASQFGVTSLMYAYPPNAFKIQISGLIRLKIIGINKANAYGQYLVIYQNSIVITENLLGTTNSDFKFGEVDILANAGDIIYFYGRTTTSTASQMNVFVEAIFVS